MISLCTPNTPLPVPQASWTSAYVFSRLAAYGTKQPFASVYTDLSGNVLSILDGHAVLAGETPDTEEWAAFLKLQPDIFAVSANAAVAGEMAAAYHTPPLYQSVMRLLQRLRRPAEQLETPSPREIYALLKAVFGSEMQPFDSWYVDISHRMRHELCHACGIYADGKLVSAVMTVAESEPAIVLGGVATLPSYRKRGFASRCLQGLISHFHEEKTIFIKPKNDAAQRLYQQLGFVICDKIGTIRIKDVES